jgi:hypothetical protein
MAWGRAGALLTSASSGRSSAPGVLGRGLYITFLQEAGAMAGLDFCGAIGRLRQSMAIIPPLAEAIRQGYLEEAAAHISRIAQEEVEAYRELSQVVGAADLALPR